MLKAICAHESLQFSKTKQMGTGPARGFCQVEPQTLRSLMKTLCKRKDQTACDNLKEYFEAAGEVCDYTNKKVCTAFEQFRDDAKDPNNWSGPGGTILEDILMKKNSASYKVVAAIMRYQFSTYRTQSFNNSNKYPNKVDAFCKDEYEKDEESGEYVLPEPPGGDEEDPDKPTDSPNANGTDVASGDTAKNKWAYAEEWRRWWHKLSSVRMTYKQLIAQRCITEIPAGKAESDPCTNEEWIACRAELRLKFMNSYCAILKRMREIKEAEEE